MFITHVFAIFKSKQFVNYLNGYNKITLVNYNLRYMFRIFYDFFINLEMREKKKIRDSDICRQTMGGTNLFGQSVGIWAA
jgi:hypothetical protein